MPSTAPYLLHGCFGSTCPATPITAFTFFDAERTADDAGFSAACVGTSDLRGGGRATGLFLSLNYTTPPEALTEFVMTVVAIRMKLRPQPDSFRHSIWVTRLRLYRPPALGLSLPFKKARIAVFISVPRTDLRVRSRTSRCWTVSTSRNRIQ